MHINQRLYDHCLLENFRYPEGFLVSIDGTGQFASSSIRCPQCCQRHHRNGSIGYYHQLLAAVIVHPDQKQVLPLFPEAITHQDGESKNDCELNASKRLVKQLREAFPNWPIRVVEDSLFANGPHINLLKELGVTSRARPWFRRRGEAEWMGVGWGCSHRGVRFRGGCDGS
jgi:hypothetical protein